MSAYNNCTYGNVKGLLYISHIWLYSTRLHIDLLLLVTMFHSCGKLSIYFPLSDSGFLPMVPELHYIQQVTHNLSDLAICFALLFGRAFVSMSAVISSVGQYIKLIVPFCTTK